MQKLAEEKERMAQKKELEVARLRILQERIQDKRSAQDEERAKRYQDEYELLSRCKQQEVQAKQKLLLQDLEAARVAQIAWKQSQKEELRRIEQEEFAKIMKLKQEADEQEHRKELARLKEQYRYQQRLLGQIESRKERRSKEKAQLLEEGRKIHECLAQEKALLEAVKNAKLRELDEMGIPDKFKSQLARVKPALPLCRTNVQTK